MPNFIGPLALVFLRVFGAAALFWLISLFVKTKPVDKADLKKMFWLSMFGIVINQICFMVGLSLTQPINSAIIMISNPVIVFVFTLVVLKERLTFLKVGGLAVALSGALVLLLFKGNMQMGSETLLGDFMTLVNSVSWAVFFVMAKPIMLKYDTITATRWIFLFGAICMLPIGIGDVVHTNWNAFTGSAVFATGFVVLGTTFLAYLLNLYSLRALSPSVTSAYIYMQPFLATLFAVWMGQDKLTPTKIVSGILIILGLYLVNYKTKKTQS